MSTTNTTTTAKKEITFKPKGNNILFLLKKEEEMTSGGIIIPESHKKQLNQGTVIAIGPDVDPERVQVGEEIIFPLHMENLIKIDGIQYATVLDSEIILGNK